MLISCQEKSDRHVIMDSTEKSESHDSSDENNSTLGKILKGEHKLIKNGKSYLMFSSSRNSITFTWLYNDQICNSTLPIEKIRFKYDEYAKEPFIKFAWKSTSNNEYLQTYFDKYVSYALIHTNLKEHYKLIHCVDNLIISNVSDTTNLGTHENIR